MGEWLLSRRDSTIVARHEYLFSAPIVVVVVLGWDRGGFAKDGIGMNGESKRQSFAGSREKRTRTKDDWEMTLNRYRHEVPG
jgi:hypothetical protein